MYEANDLYFTADGDYLIDKTGDLSDTSDDQYRSLRQEIATIAAANFNDWAIHPNIGANFAELIGHPNNEDTASLVSSQLEAALAADLLKSGDFRVDTIPLDVNTLGVMVTVKVDTVEGDIQTIAIPLIFNLGLGIYAA